MIRATLSTRCTCKRRDLPGNQKANKSHSIRSPQNVRSGHFAEVRSKTFLKPCRRMMNDGNEAYTGHTKRCLCITRPSLFGRVPLSWSSESLHHIYTAIDWTLTVIVGICTAQTLQDDHFTDIGAQRKPSTPTDVTDAEICQSTWATPLFSMRQSAGASDPNDSAHQGECERHSGPRPGRAEMHMVHCAAIARAAQIEDAHTLVTNHDKPHAASCHQAPSESVLGCTIGKKRKLLAERVPVR